MADFKDDSDNPHLNVQMRESFRGPFVSTAVALTQGTINHNLKILFFEKPAFKQIKVSTNSASIDGQLKSGQISIPASNTANKTVFYHCIFASGTAKLPNDNSLDKIDLTDWEFVFAVDIGSIVLPNGVERNQVAKAMGRNGRYDILALFLDFTRNKILQFEKSLSKFPNCDLNSRQLDAFESLMSEWARYVASKAQDTTTFSYVLRTNDQQSVAPEAPIFPPLELRVQTYPYKQPLTGEVTTGINGKGDRNVLLYLARSVYNQSLPLKFEWTGNFVKEGMHGNTCIAREIIWNEFFFQRQPKLLNDLNLAFQPYVKNLKFRFQESGNREQWVWSAEYGIGETLNGRIYDPGVYVWQDAQDGHGWTWETRNDDYSNDGNNYTKGKLDGKCEGHNKIDFQVGTNEIDCSGVNTNTFGIKITDHDDDWKVISKARAELTLIWNLKIAVIISHEGHLELSLVLPEDLDKMFTHDYKTLELINVPAEQWKSDIEKHLQDTRLKVKERLKTMTIPEINSHIARVAAFTLPGNGTFTYKDPIWSSTGDLMVDLNYVQGTDYSSSSRL